MKKITLSEVLDISVFGRPAKFTVLRIEDSKGQLLDTSLVKESTQVQVVSSEDQLKPSSDNSPMYVELIPENYCADIHQNEVLQLQKLIAFFRQTDIPQELKMRFVSLSGRSKSGKSTIMKKLASTSENVRLEVIDLRGISDNVSFSFTTIGICRTKD